MVERTTDGDRGRALQRRARPPMTRLPLVAKRAEELLGASVVATAPVAGGDISTATRLRLSDGTTALMKTLPHAPEGFFDAEARGLRWLAEVAGGVAVPEVLGVDHECLILRWVEPGKTTVDAAVAFGRALAATHAAGAPAYGLDERRLHRPAAAAEPDRADTWAEFYATRRVLPYLKLARDRGARHRRGRRRHRGGDRPAARPAAGGAAVAAARRPLERQRALGPRRRRPGDRPGGVRRAPRGRPRDAGAVRAAAPAAGDRRLRRGRAARRRLGGAAAAAPAVPAARARLPVRRRVRRPRAAEIAARFA